MFIPTDLDFSYIVLILASESQELWIVTSIVNFDKCWMMQNRVQWQCIHLERTESIHFLAAENHSLHHFSSAVESTKLRSSPSMYPDQFLLPFVRRELVLHF